MTLTARGVLLDAAAIGPLRQAPGRTLLAIVAIALGVALGFSVYLINRVAAGEVAAASRSLFGMADLAVQAPGLGFDEALFPKLAAVPGVAVASPVVEAQARLPGRDRSLKLVGIDPFRAARLQPALATAGATVGRTTEPAAGSGAQSVEGSAASSIEGSAAGPTEGATATATSAGGPVAVPAAGSVAKPADGSAAGRSAGETAQTSASAGSGLLADDAVWLSPAAAQAFALSIGDEFDVQVALDTVRLRVAGLLPAGEYRQPLGMLDIATAQWRLDRLGRLNRVDLRLAPGADPVAVQSAVRALLPPGVRLTTPGEASDDAVRLTRAYRSNLTALALVALFTGAFLVYATQSLAVARRRREIALLHAMGMTVREQLGASLLSGALVGVVGAALGVALGVVVARAGLAAFGADLGAGYFRGLAPELVVRPFEVVVFLALGVATALFATLGPASEAASVPAAAALKAGDEAPLAARRHGRVAVALVAAAAVALLLPSVEGIALPGYAAIACLLLASVSLTPTLSHFVFARLPTSGAPWLQIAAAQLQGTARRSTVSIAAVLVSFGLMVAMAIMVYSFRNSLDAWMQRIVPADLYVRAGTSGLTSYLDESAQRAIASTEGIARVDFVRFQEVAMPGPGLPLTVIARPISEETASRILPLRRVDSRPAPPGTVPVWASEAALDLRGYDVGTVFELPLAGRTLRASVRGLWRDYERPGGAVVLPRDVFVDYTGDTRATTASMWLERGAAPDEVASRIRAALRRSGEYEIAVPREIRRRSLEVFDRTFAVTYLLEAVAVLIGLFGVSASTSSQVLARRGEFGMLRHLGITRGEIGRMLAFEGAALGAVGVATGLVVGFVVSLVLIYVVNRQSFHWTMDLHVPWALLAALSVVLVAAAALTAAASGRQAMGADVVRAVKEDW